MKPNTYFVETRDAETLEDIILRIAYNCCRKAKPDNDRTYHDNSSRSNASSVVVQN